MTDEQLQHLLQSALPPVDSGLGPRDAWPAIATRVNSYPTWSPFDLALAAGIVMALLLFPETLFLLALHL